MIRASIRGAFALLWFAACSGEDSSLVRGENKLEYVPACKEEGLQHFGDTLLYCGLITSETVQLLKAQDLSNVTRLVINSGGGNSNAAIEIGRQLRSHGISVVVQNWCLSACAQFVLPSANEVTLMPESLVGLHHTGHALHMALTELEGLEHPAGEIASKAELAYYEELGVAPIYLDLPLRNLKVDGLVLIQPLSSDDDTEIYYAGPSFLLLDATSLERMLGVRVIGTGKADALASGDVVEISRGVSGLYLDADDLDFDAELARSFARLCVKRRGSAEMTCKDYQ